MAHGRFRWKFGSDRSGNVTIIFAGALFALLGAAALAVDTGVLYLSQRKLQGIADAAAMASVSAMDDGRAAAERAVAANGAAGVARFSDFETGSYVPDANIAEADRFQVYVAPANATRITLKQDVPIYFGRLLTGQSHSTVQASAMAARLDYASFSIGSRLASVQGGAINGLLNGLTGSDLGLTVMDAQGLVDAKIDLLSYIEALRTSLDLNTASFGEVLNTQVALPKLVSAMADAAPTLASKSALSKIASQVNGTKIKLGDLINLGPINSSIQSGDKPQITVGSLSLLREVLTASNGNREVAVDLGAGVPGLASAKFWLAIGERPANSPWIAVSAKHQITVRTAQARLYIEAGVPDLLGIASVRLPALVELAQAEAKLDQIDCSGGQGSASVTLAVTPSIGSASLSDIDISQLNDFKVALPHSPAVVARVGSIEVKADAKVQVGGVSAQSVRFSSSDIAADTVKTVATDDAVTGLATSLIGNMSLSAKLGSYSVPLLPQMPVLASTLTTAAPKLDLLLNQLTGELGIGLGEADVQVQAVRCGTPTLVG